MRKRVIATVMALVLSIAMLTGCGGSAKKDYLSDIKEFSEMNADAQNISDDPAEMVKELKSVLKNLNVKTTEAQTVKSDLQDLVDLMDNLLANQDTMDADAQVQALTDLMNISNSLEKDMETFIEAAEDAGVDDGDIEDLDIDFGF